MLWGPSAGPTGGSDDCCTATAHSGRVHTSPAATAVPQLLPGSVGGPPPLLQLPSRTPFTPQCIARAILSNRANAAVHVEPAITA
eukprot:277276-Chlamydomonas_euryale.AAC.7